jgi:hypothetical protein
MLVWVQARDKETKEEFNAIQSFDNTAIVVGYLAGMTAHSELISISLEYSDEDEDLAGA